MALHADHRLCHWPRRLLQRRAAAVLRLHRQGVQVLWPDRARLGGLDGHAGHGGDQCADAGRCRTGLRTDVSRSGRALSQNPARGAHVAVAGARRAGIAWLRPWGLQWRVRSLAGESCRAGDCLRSGGRRSVPVGRGDAGGARQRHYHFAGCLRLSAALPGATVAWTAAVLLGSEWRPDLGPRSVRCVWCCPQGGRAVPAWRPARASKGADRQSCAVHAVAECLGRGAWCAVVVARRLVCGGAACRHRSADGLGRRSICPVVFRQGCRGVRACAVGHGGGAFLRCRACA